MIEDVVSSDHDVVVVGGGVAGCALVHGLVEQGKRVLLLERGSVKAHEDRRVKDLQRWWAAASSPSSFTTSTFTVAQQGLNGRMLPVWQGSGGGGTGNINAALWMRGRKEDYQSWPWRIEDIERSFEEVERRYQLETVEARGVGVALRDMLLFTGLTDATQSASRSKWSEQGLCTQVRFSKRGGERMTPWEAFVLPHSTSPLLSVMDRCSVERVILESGRAVALEMMVEEAAEGSAEKGRRKKLRLTNPRAQVVLCSGAIKTPQLLLLSGIGPSEELEPLGIATEVYLPAVGRNLQDHMLIAMANLSQRQMREEDFNEVGFHGTAEFSSKSTGAWCQIMLKDTQDVPDMAPIILTTSLTKQGLVYTLLRSFFQRVVSFACSFSGVRRAMQQSVGIGLALVDPFSRGSITLSSSNPSDPPRVDPRYLEDERDWQTFGDMFQLARASQSSPEASSWLSAELEPGPMYGYAKTQQKMRSWIKNNSIPYFHLAGSCRMGQNASSSVVDAQLKVHGVKNLRVADASVTPRVPCAPTQAVAAMIGYFASCIISEDK